MMLPISLTRCCPPPYKCFSRGRHVVIFPFLMDVLGGFNSKPALILNQDGLNVHVILQVSFSNQEVYLDPCTIGCCQLTGVQLQRQFFNRVARSAGRCPRGDSSLSHRAWILIHQLEKVWHFSIPGDGLVSNSQVNTQMRFRFVRCCQVGMQAG